MYKAWCWLCYVIYCNTPDILWQRGGDWRPWYIFSTRFELWILPYVGEYAEWGKYPVEGNDG